MINNQFHILSTRPLNLNIIADAQKQNILLQESSFIETIPSVDRSIINKIQRTSALKKNIIFTSMNAVESVYSNITNKPNWKIYCIGSATRRLIEDYFIESTIVNSARDAAELSQKIIEDKIKEAVFFCGNIRRDNLPDTLRENNIHVEEIIVYDTIEVSIQLDKKFDGILFFSPSAVESFFKTNTIQSDTILFSIGATTAEQIKKYTNNKVIISSTTDKEIMVREVIDYFKVTMTKNL